MRRRGGFTILELLVATSVMVILGGAVVVVLRGGVRTWRRGETRRESFEVVQAVLAQLSDDLQCATIDPESSHGGRTVDHLFVGDLDDDARSRLALVRTIRGESENTITGHAGSSIGADARIDYHDDMKKALDKRLRATGGLMEVAWCMGKPGTPQGEVLFRGIRSPVGGSTSFFVTDSKGEATNFYMAQLPGNPAPKTPPAEGVAFCRAFATKVVHFELLYATPYTNTWSTAEPPRRTLKEPSGPLPYWDSTRAILRPDKNASVKLFTTFLDPSSRGDPSDDILPARVKLTLVVREGDAAETSTSLLRDVGPDSTDLTVTEPSRLNKEGGFLYLDHEWIEYDSVAGAQARVKTRGARNTEHAAHRSGTEVVIGRTFEAVIPLPCAREDWGDR
jgi:type II secretory pathway pseudopilin PulG